MIKRLFLVLALLIAPCAFAQTTTVTATVIDPNGNPYSNGTVTAFLILNTGQPIPPGARQSSGPFPLTAQGTFSFSLASPLAYTFGICGTPTNVGPRGNPTPNSLCFSTLPIAIGGASQDITGSLGLIPLLGPSGSSFVKTTVSGLPTFAFKGNVVGVTDGLSSTDCVTGGGASVVICQFTGTSWVNLAGSAAAGGLTTQSQVNSGGVLSGTGCETFPNLVTGPISENCEWQSKGPNPHADIRAYGARAVTTNIPPASPGITAGITGGTATATLSAASTFQNGDGVVIFGAGAAHALATPVAPTVTPSLASGGVATGIVVNGPGGGATTYNYQVIARNKAGGMTAAGPVGTTASGAAALGIQTVSITSQTRSGRVVTVVTSSAHGISAGSMVNIPVGGVTSPSDFSGWFMVTTVADNTHFTYQNGNDTAQGGLASSTGGSVNWWNCNHLSWTAVPGAWLYYIYGRTGGSLTLLGATKPQTIIPDPTWDDFGATYMGGVQLPFFVPTTPPGAATSNNFSTTISSGAGTTSLILAANAGTTVAGATILFDNAPALQAAATANVGGGVLYIPTTGNFVINSYVTLPSLMSISQGGGLYLNDTVEMGSSSKWQGSLNPQGNSATTFAFEPQAVIQVNRAYPGFYSSGQSCAVRGIQFNNLGNQGLSSFFDGSQVTLEGISGNYGGGTDFTGAVIIFRGSNVSNVFFNNLNNITLTANQGSGSPAPLFYCNFFGFTQASNWSLSGRSIIFRGSEFALRKGRIQAGSFPAITNVWTNGNDFGYTVISDFDQDTMANPLYADLVVVPNSSTKLVYIQRSGTPTGGGVVTGVGSANGPLYFSDLVPTAPLGASGSASYNANFLGAVGYLMAAPAAPVVNIGAPASCVANCLGAGTYNYKILNIDLAGKESPQSPTGSGTTDGTQTVQVCWTSVPGATATRRFQGGVSDTAPGGGFTGGASGCYFDSTLIFYSNSSLLPGGNAASFSSFGVAGSPLTLSPVLFANLGTPRDGTFVFCQDCTIANPCAGAGTGAYAKRLNGVWVCN